MGLKHQHAGQATHPVDIGKPSRLYRGYAWPRDLNLVCHLDALQFLWSEAACCRFCGRTVTKCSFVALTISKAGARLPHSKTCPLPASSVCFLSSVCGPRFALEAGYMPPGSDTAGGVLPRRSPSFHFTSA